MHSEFALRLLKSKGERESGGLIAVNDPFHIVIK